MAPAVSSSMHKGKPSIIIFSSTDSGAPSRLVLMKLKKEGMISGWSIRAGLWNAKMANCKPESFQNHAAAALVLVSTSQPSAKHVRINSWGVNDYLPLLDKMTLAAKLESATSKHAVTPGELLPAAELLGDMLLELNQPQEAIAHYEKSLERSPGRFNSLYGAARAAELSGDNAKAKAYYETLVGMSEKEEISFGRREKALSFLSAL